MKFVFLFVLIFCNYLLADNLKISLSSMKMDYVENDTDGKYLDSEASDYGSDILGLSLNYSKDLGVGIGGGDIDLVEISLDYFNGQSRYDGFLFSSTTGRILSPYQTMTDTQILDAKVRLSEIKFGSLYDVKIFTSLGNRYWVRDSSSDKYGYKEIYNWAYLDIGMGVLFHDNNWDLGFEGAYQYALSPKMTAYLNGTMEFDLGTTSGYYFEVPLTYNIDKKYALELSYKYNYWHINRSNVVNGYVEPESKSKNEIIKIGFIIKW